ncbi:MAG: hypothetical protein LBR71_06395 [Synergistaceae bacterium]|jgi:hypothetical protein|nr:hypothetical protein [Synergistaceae bacterium]
MMPDMSKRSLPPVAVADDEIILRSIDTRHLTKLGGKKTNIFMPPYGKAEISVMRYCYMPIEMCKKKGKTIALNAKQTFKGFAALKCSAARNASVDVKDSREYFLGHADIIYSSPRPPNAEPNRAPEDVRAVSEFLTTVKRLVDACKLFLDADPASGDWQGEEIRL